MIKNALEIKTASFSRNIMPLVKVSEIISDKDSIQTTPFEFKYNGSWKVNHECPKCKVNCQIRYDVDKNRFPYYFNNYNQSKYLCEEYYRIEVLNEFNQIFRLCELKIYNGKSYLTKLGRLDRNFPIISSIKLIYNKCSNCGSEYVMHFENYPPLQQEKNNPKGKNGLIVINGIIHVELENSLNIKSFLDGNF